MSELIGKAIPRLDGKLKVTGQARYAADWPMPNLAHAVIFQSEVASGRIHSFNLWAARQVPGVIDIITYENAPRISLPGKDGVGESFAPLQNNRVFYNGQAIGVVVANSLEAAMSAARLARAYYTQTEAKLDFEKHLGEAFEIKKMQPIGKINHERGGTKKAFGAAEVKHEAVYTQPAENHNPMEPSATVASWENGKLKVYDATQAVWKVSELYSKAFHIDRENIQVITKFVGGAFGCKGSMWPHQLLAVMAAKKVARPVKLVVTREQMFTGVGHRPFTLQRISLGSEKSGKLVALEHTITGNTGVNKDYSERAAMLSATLYQCENVKTTHRLVKLNYQVPTFMRAPGYSSGSFAIESAMDELAHKVGIDPVDLRLLNYADMDGERDAAYSAKSLRECYEAAAKKFDWSRRLKTPGSLRDGDYLVGFGMATAIYPAHRFGATARVELSSDGNVKVISATQDLGTGTYTVMTQIAADALGLEMSRVTFDLGDSLYPEAGVSGGSTTAASVGTAIEDACRQIREQVVYLAINDKGSSLFGAKSEDLALGRGFLYHSKENGKKETYEKLLQRGGKNKIVATGKNPDEMKAEGPSKYSFGAQFSEVKVHRLTGEVRLVKHVGAFACGKILNALTAHSQFMGGIVFGIGQCLTEATIPDVRNGRLAVKDLADYHLPTNMDVPPIEVIMIPEKDDKVNPIGVKGIGEIGNVGVAAAIANAVFNATGKRIRELPLTLDKVLAA